MIKNFKLFEKLGIDKLVYDITEKIWANFLKVYNKNKVFKSKEDTFNTDVSEFNIGYQVFGVTIQYNNAESIAGFPMSIGAISRIDNTKIKTLSELKEEIIHEVQHNIYALRKYGKIKDIPKFETKKKEFLNSKGVTKLISSDIIGVFLDQKSNVYNQKKSLFNFMKYDKFSDKYKKLLIYLYLSEDNELSSKLHEFIIRIKNLEDNSEIFKNEKIVFLKEMIDFKMKPTDFTESELKKIDNILFKIRDMKKVEKYINMKGEKFIKKAHKLLYFKDPDTNI